MSEEKVEAGLVRFEFAGCELNVMNENGEVWFVANDVAKALGYVNPRDAVATHCKGVAKRYTWVETGKKADGSPAMRETEVNVIPEADLYRLVFSSKLPKAEAFVDYVTEKVLPSVRKYGIYGTPQTMENMIANPAFAIRLLTEVQERNNQIEELKRTKAHITAGREAKALGAIGGLTRALNDAKELIELQSDFIDAQVETIDDLEGNGNFSTIDENGYWLKNYVTVSKTKGVIGMLLTRISRVNGFPIDRFRRIYRTDESFNDKKVYHNGAWKIMEDLLATDKTVLAKHRKDLPDQDYLF